MSYIPGTYDGGPIEHYLQDQLQRISEVLQPVVDGEMQQRYVLPDRPRSGLYLADGTDWDPGSGYGLYIYDEAGETFDYVGGGPSGTSVSSFNTRTGAVVPVQSDYDSFFLTPAEGNAAYAPLSHVGGNIHLDWTADQGVTNIHTGNYTNTIYTHPNDGVDPGAALTGANVFSDISVNALGHVTGSATRALTPANIGAATSSHQHTTYDRASSVLSGANVFSNLVITDGIVTSTATRALTAANIGAATSGHNHTGVYLPIAGTAANSTLLTSLGVSGGSTPPSGSQILKSHTNGYTYVGWLNTVSGTATSPSRFYCSQDAFLRYQTATNFRNTLEAISGWDFNGATKPRVDGLGIPYYVTSTYTGGKITVAASAPGSPAKGDLWFDTT
jgi:hypothetical protein